MTGSRQTLTNLYVWFCGSGLGVWSSLGHNKVALPISRESGFLVLFFCIPRKSMWGPKKRGILSPVSIDVLSVEGDSELI